MKDRSSATRTVSCPGCGEPVEWSARSRWRPFCSERCRLVDLGAWFDESQRIPGEESAGEPTGDTDTYRQL